MKRSAFFLIVCFLLIANNMFAQQTVSSAVTDSTGLPGDNFSLQGALQMFKQSKTPEDFEKKLNTENNYVNNLDLNGDGKIDYVRVIDKSKGNVHAIVLQVAVNKTESQDIAVIGIEKQGKESAILQIIGDKELYGDSAFVEPVDAKGEKAGGAGPSAKISSISLFFVNVWFWPCVSYIYEPVYVVYVSPWYWDYYPMWWSPWYPMPWYRHHYYCNDYYYYGYRPVYTHRVIEAHDIYYGNRSTSMTVSNRYHNAHEQYQANRSNQIHNAYNNNQTKNRTDNYNQGKPVNNNQGKINNNLQSKPANNYPDRINNYDKKPAINNQGKLNNLDHNSGNYNQGKTNNSYDKKPVNSNQNKPMNNYQSKPGNNNQNKPGNNYQSKPNNNIQSKPGNNIQDRPSNNQKGQNGSINRSVTPSSNGSQKGTPTKSNQGMQQNNSNRSEKGKIK